VPAIVITGVSRGLGRALFDRLAARGDTVLALGRRFTAAQEALATGSGRVTLRPTDLRDPAALPGVDELRGALAGADEVALIHNAGVVEPIGKIGTLEPAALAATVSVNLTAPMVLTNAFLAARPAGARTRILFVSSGAAHRVIEGWAAYCATKAGGEMFFEAVAAQLSGEPDATAVNVNPGVMDTDMQGAIRDAAQAGAYFPDSDRFLGLHERGELPDPAQVADRIVAAHL
jgi:NAD(P)-dependent dehydrogenase (short-subunit alcohol dehydrogenase family)